MSDKYNKEEPSVLQKIQDKTGCLLLVIGIAMLAFVLTDFLGQGQTLFSGGNSIGTIAGEDVDVTEYDDLVNQYMEDLRRNNPGMEINEQLRASRHQMAWNQLVQSKLVATQYEALGISISSAELKDVTIGDNPDASVVRAFTNPQTNQFDRSQLLNFIESLPSDPERRRQWIAFEKNIEDKLKSEKYNVLLQKMFYGTELEARHNIKDQELTINANVVGLNYNTIADSTINVTDGEIMDYVKAHSYKYKQEASRDIEFVVFDVRPSSDDTAAALKWITENIDEFKETDEDSLYVYNKGSETPFDPTYKVRGSFTPDVEDALFAADTNQVLGPYENQGVYGLFKITGIGSDSLKSVRSSHILLIVNGRTAEDTANTEKEARELLAKIRSGETTFEDEARSRNYDGTGAQGGDLGWLREGTSKVPEKFMKKALSTGNGGYFIVTTKNGVHIGKVTSDVSSRTIQVARLTRTVEASSSTEEMVYRRAGEFYSEARNAESFEELAEAMGYTKRIAKNITESERRVSGIKNGNIISRWLFNDNTGEGDVSDVIEVDEKYVVARCVKIRKEGLPDVDDIRTDVEPLVMNQKKAEILKKKIEEALKSATTAEELAQALETVVSPAPAANFTAGSIPYVGRDDQVVGAIFGVPVGQHSGVIEGTTGVYVVFVNNENQYELNTNIADLKMDLSNRLNTGVDASIEQALLKLGEVTDRRYRFFDN